MADEYQTMVSSGRGPRSPAAMTWFRNQVMRLLRTSKGGVAPAPPSAPGPLLQTPVVRTVSGIRAGSVGSMYTFSYDPKFKATLPYYDTFPLVFVIAIYNNGFLGINLHYLPPMLRAMLMDGLVKIVNNQKYDWTTKLNVTYGYLKATSELRNYKPCVKRYLRQHVMSAFVQIPPTEWAMGVFMPTQNFVKASTSTVWAESERRI